jgi:hypothetical protein
MADSTIDWKDVTPRPLPELARLAFPDGGVTGETLRRRAREGKLPACRPGKSYMASLSDVRIMIEKTRVHPAQERAPRPSPAVPNSLGLTEMDLSRMALDRLLNGLTDQRKNAKQLRDEERARAAPAHRLKMQKRRRARARNRYHEKKAKRAKDAPK